MGVSVPTPKQRTPQCLLAEKVMVLPGVEQVLRQFRFARQQAEAFRLGHDRPKAVAPANGAVATIRILGEVQVGFEGNGAAVATASICLQH